MESAFDPINEFCDSTFFPLLWHLRLHLPLISPSEGIHRDRINSIHAAASEGSETAASRNRRRGTYEWWNKEQGKDMAAMGPGRLKGSGFVFPDGERCWHEDFSAGD